MRQAKLRVNHLAYPSFNAGETYRFYTEVMGFDLTFAASGVSPEWGNKAYMMTGFGFGGGEIHFFDLDGMKRPKADGLPKDIRHVALSVGSRAEVRAWRKRLERHGVSYWVEDHDGAPSVYFSDPNGVMFEITVQPSGRAGQNARSEALEIISDWTVARHQRPPREGAASKRLY